jgi:hypothetical protein
MKCLRYFSLATITGLAMGAHAAGLEIAGDASGLFNDSTTSFGGLSYLGSSFDVFTADGFFALGGNAGSPNYDNLGSLTLSPDAFDYGKSLSTFTLDVTFTDPAGSFDGASTFTAPLVGQVVNDKTGGVYLDFMDSSKIFGIGEDGKDGWFTLHIDPVAISPGQTVSLNGYGNADISTPPLAPAPGALASMGLGLLGCLVRRRKS